MGTTKRDEHGEYDPDAGSPHPLDEDEVGYEPCNAVLRHTWSRYGERRYCAGMAVGNFGDAANYEHPDFCKHHQSRASLMKRHEEDLKTGAHSKSHEHVFQYLPPHKQLLANDLYKSLVAESSYDFEAESVELEVDASDHDFGADADVIVLDHPVPNDYEMRATALWFAALDFVQMESIKEEQFRVAFEEDGPRGGDLAVGERVKVVSVTEDGRRIEDRDEHHLNLPLSRLQKDYERHLSFGGVEGDADGDDEMGRDEWVVEFDMTGGEADVQPEAKSSDSSPLHDVGDDDVEIEALDETDGGGA
jgi:hypothetical protein